MAERGGNCYGLILDAYLIGAPCTGRGKRWDKITKVVAGKIVNAYCKWVIHFISYYHAFAILKTMKNINVCVDLS